MIKQNFWIGLFLLGLLVPVFCADTEVDVERDSTIISPYQTGTYFLSEDVESYVAPHAYFFGVEYSEGNQYVLTWNQCINTFRLVSTLQEVYTDAGANSFTNNNGGYPYSNPLYISPDYNKVFVTNIPLNGSLYVYITPLSAVNSQPEPGDGGQNIMHCMMLNTIYNCLCQSSTSNKFMIDSIVANTDITLSPQNCLSSNTLAVITCSSIFGGIFLCIILCCLCSKCKSKKNNVYESLSDA